MKTLFVISDSFKGTLSSKDISLIVKETVSEYFPKDFTVKSQLIADGGEGTIEAFSSFNKGKIYYIPTFDAENNKIVAPLFVSNDNFALIEVASIVGLPMIKNNLNPLKRTTRGIGILIRKAISLGIKKIYVGLGGTSTNDLGIGMLQELGIDFKRNHRISMFDVDSVADIDTSKFLLNELDVEFILLSDVKNPLLGEDGATKVFGYQKGYFRYIDYLEKEMTHLCSLFEKTSKKTLNGVPSLGAAGGLAGAFYAFTNAKIKSGIDEILSLSNFKENVKDADYVITGEGSFDSQSLNGKVVSGILKHVEKNKLIIICGKSKISRSDLKIYETSNTDEPFEVIKKNAKNNYKRTLIHVLKSLC